MEEYQNNRSLTILITALNEERLIELTVNEILPVASETLNEYEIILINDGSQDKTGMIMDQLASQYSEIQVVHHPKPGGVGNAFKVGLALAKFEKLVLLTGDREITVEGFKRLTNSIGESDLIIGYRDNQIQARMLFRLIISYIFRHLMVMLFGYDIKDYHGVPIYPVKIVRKLNTISNGYPFQPEVLIRLLRLNVSFSEVPFSVNKENDGNSQVICFKTFYEFLKMIWYLLRS
jgi:glycosyltransferase involved in cell wall biosynthesis